MKMKKTIYITLKIDLSDNNLRELKPFTFGSIKEILNLDLSENYLNFLPENLFDGSKVGDLNFANNLIEELESNSFENAQLEVSKADFSNNQIELLDEKLFEKWQSLKELNFDHNQIKVLPEKLFDNIKIYMQEVSFVDNEISEIGYNTFVNGSFLKIIDLRNNACFDIIFGDDDRKQHEICSDNCEESCYLVNSYMSYKFFYTYPTTSPRPGAFRGRQLCKEGQTVVKNRCRYVRRRHT
jgi:hypothetical protein